MKSVTGLLPALFVTAIAQLAVPLSLVIQRKRVLAHGHVFEFRTAPVDPYDAFRGRYVVLASDGYARFASANLRRPAGPGNPLK